MSRYVVLAADRHPDFSFLLPLSCILWNERTGYTPLLISDELSWALEFLRTGGRVEWVRLHGRGNDRMCPKLARWYAPMCHGSRVDEYLLTDVDLWPIDGKFWDRDSGDKPATLFYADAFGGSTAHVPTAAVRATGQAFKEILRGGTIEVKLEQLRRLPEDDERRYSDDAAQAELFYGWSGWPDRVQKINRGPSPPKDRIDRSAWPDRFELSGKVDAHLPRDASDRRLWLKILPLFDLLAPNWSGWVRAYRDAWERGVA